MTPRRDPSAYLLTMLTVVLEFPIVAVLSVGALLTRAFALRRDRQRSASLG
jgi:hypothetical protein